MSKLQISDFIDKDAIPQLGKHTAALEESEKLMRRRFTFKHSASLLVITNLRLVSSRNPTKSGEWVNTTERIYTGPAFIKVFLHFPSEEVY